MYWIGFFSGVLAVLVSRWLFWLATRDKPVDIHVGFGEKKKWD